MKRLACVYAFAFCSTSLTFFSSQAQDFQSLSVVERGGARNLPASVLAIIGQEGGGFTGEPPRDTAFTDEAQFDRMLKGIESASARYANDKQGLKVLQGNHDQLQLHLRLSSIVLNNRAASVLIEIGSKALSDRVNSVIEESSAYYQKEYETSVKKVVYLAVSRTNAAIVNKWDGKITEQNVGEAMKEIFDGQADFFNRYALADMSLEAKMEIMNAKADMVATALARQKAMSDAERAADRAELESQITTQSDEIKKVAKDVVTFRSQWEDQLTSLKTMQEATAASLTAEMSTLRLDVSGVQSDVNAIQLQMWRGMGPREQLAALQDGFMRSMDPAEKAKTITSLKAAVTVMDKRDKALEVLGYAGQLSGLLAQVGMPIDVQNFQKNLDTANVAVNVISNFALGNWMGALQSAGGLFGGGGQDAGAARHEEIMKTLGVIIELQQKTLQRLDELSDQITRSTNAILTKLDKMDSKLDLIVDLNRHTAFRGFGSCREFIQRARNAGMNGSTFSNYEARRTHFNQLFESGYGASYTDCRAFLNTYKEVNGSDAVNSGAVAPLLFREETIASSDKEKLGPELRRMLNLTWDSVGLTGPGACANRLLAYLSDAPSYLSGLRPTEVHCTSTVNPERELISQNGKAVEGAQAMSDALSAGTIRSVVNNVLFFAPYGTLLAPAVNGAPPSRLLTVDELLSRGDRSADPNDDAVLWPKHYLDLLNLAMAQQTAFSGAYAIPAAQKILRESSFGRTNAGGWLAKDKVLEDRSCLGDLPEEATTYQALSCVLAENPYFLSNLLRQIVREGLVRSKASLPYYEFARGSNDGGHIRKLLTDLPLVWNQPKDGASTPWHIEFHDAAGTPWLIPLPTTSEVRADTIIYRPVAGDLEKLRKALQDRIILQDPEVQELANDPASGFLFRRAVMSTAFLTQANLE